MAKQLNVNLAMTADTSKAKAELQALQKQLNDIMMNASKKDSTLGLSSDIQKATQLAAQLKVQLESATSSTGKLDLTKFNEGLQKSGLKLSDYRAALSALGPEGSQAFSKLASSIMQAEVPLRRSSALLTNFATTLKNTARWQISSSILHGFMGALQGAYGYAQDLNESLNNIRIVTGQGVEQMSRFAEQANRAAKELSTTTTAYTDAALIYYQQGLNDTAVKQRTDVTIKLANVSRQSAEEVSSQMTAIWNNFNDGSRSLEYYADVITALGAATASSSDEIAQGLQKFASVADTVGLSYEKATAALATVVAETRQSADVVGTAFKTMFARFQGLSLGKTLEDGVDLNKYSKALQTIGVNILDTNGQLKRMDDILDETYERWNSISEAQRVALAETVAGTRQYAQFMAIMNNYGKIQANQLLAEGSEGTLQKQADIYAESWEAASKRVKAAAQGIYDDLIDDKFFIHLLNNLEKVISFFDKLIDNTGGLKGVLLTLGSVLTTVFGPQIQASINNVVAGIRSMTPAGQKAAADLRQQANKELMQVAQQAGDTPTGHAMEAAYSSQANLQGVVLENAKYLTEEQQKQAQLLLDMNRQIGEEAIAAGQAAEQQAKITEQLETQALLQAKKKNDKYNSFEDDAGNTHQRTQSEKDDAFKEVRAAQENLKQVEIGFVKTRNAASLLASVTKTIPENLATSKQEAKSFQDSLRGASKIVSETFKNNNKAFDLLPDEVQEDLEKIETLFAKLDTEELLDPAELEDASNQIAEIAQRLQEAVSVTKTDDGKNMLGGILEQVAEAQARLSTAYQGTSMTEAEADKQTDQLTQSYQQQAQTADVASSKTIQVGNAAQQTGQKIKEMAQQQVSFGASLTTFVSTAMSVASALNAIKSIGNIWDDSSLSTGEKLLQTLISLGTILPLISNMTKLQTTLNGLFAKSQTAAGASGTMMAEGEMAAAAGAQTMKLALWEVYLIVAAVVAVVWIFVKAFEAMSDAYNADAIAAEKAKKAAKELADAATEAKDRLNDIKTAVDQYKSVIDKLNDCTKGTQEWRNALAEVHTQINELLQKYPELLNEANLFNKDGTLNIDVLERFEQRAQDVATTANAAALQGSVNAAQARLKSDITDVSRKYEYYGSDIQNEGYRNHTFSTVSNDLNKLLSTYKENGSQALELSDVYEALGSKMDANAIITDDYAKSLMSLAESSVAATRIMNNAAKLTIDQWAVDSGVELAAGQSILMTEAYNDAYTNFADEIKTASDQNNIAHNVDHSKLGSAFDNTSFKGMSVTEAFNAARGVNYGLDRNGVRGTDNNRTYAYLENGDVKEYTLAEMQATIAAAAALEKMGQAAEDASKALAGMDDATKEFLGSGSLEGLTSEEFKAYRESLGLAKGQTVTADEAKQLLIDQGVSEGVAEQLKQNFANNLNINWDSLLEQLPKSLDSKITEGLSLANGEALVKTISKLNLGPAGKQAGETFVDSINTALGSIDPDQQQEALSQILAVDWSDWDAAKQVEQILKDFNGDIDAINWKKLTTEMREAAFAFPDFNKLRDDITNVATVLNDLNFGKAIKDKDYKKLIDYNKAWEDLFITQSDGTHKFIGNEQQMKQVLKEDLAEQKKQLDERAAAVKQLKDSNWHYGDNVNNKVDWGNVEETGQNAQGLKNLWNSSSGRALLEDLGYTEERISAFSDTAPEEIKKAYEEIAKAMNGDYDAEADAWNESMTSLVANYAELLEITGQITTEAFSKRVAEMATEVAQNVTSLEELQTGLGQLGGTFNFGEEGSIFYDEYAQGLQNVAAQYTTCSEAALQYQNALNALNESTAENKQELEDAVKAAEDHLEVMIGAEEAAKQYGLEAESLAAQMHEIALKEGVSEKQALAMAIANQRMNKGIAALNKNWKDWKKTLSSTEKDSQDYADTLVELSKSVTDLVGWYDELNLDSKFVEKNMGLIEKASNGDVQSILELGAAVAQLEIQNASLNTTLADGLLVNGGENAFSKWANEVDDVTRSFSDLQTGLSDAFAALQSNMSTLEAGTPLSKAILGGISPDDFVKELNAYAAATGKTAEQMQSMLSSVGVTANVQSDYQKQEVTVPTYDEYSEVVSDSTQPFSVQSGDEWVTYEAPTWHRKTYTVPGAPLKTTGFVEVASISMEDNNGNPTPPRFTGKQAPTPSATGGKGGGGNKGTKTASHKHEVHRYSNEENTAKGLASTYDRISTAKDHAFGLDRIRLMERELVTLGKLKDASSDYLKAIVGSGNVNKIVKAVYSGKNIGELIANGELGGTIAADYKSLFSGKDASGKNLEYTSKSGDNEALTEEEYNLAALNTLFGSDIKIKLDSYGNLTNRDVLLDKIQELTNATEDAYSAIIEPSDAQETDHNKRIAYLEALKERVDQYNETAELIQEKVDEYLENIYQMQEKNAELITSRMEHGVEMGERTLKRLERALAILGDDIYKSTEAMAKWFNATFTEGIGADKEKASAYEQAMSDAYAQWELYTKPGGDLDENAIDSEHAVQIMADIADGYTTLMEDVLDRIQQGREYYGDTLDFWNDKLQATTSLIEANANSLDHLQNVLGLLGRSVDYKSLGTILGGQYNIAQSAYEANKAISDEAYREWQRALNQYNSMRQQGANVTELEEFRNAELDKAEADYYEKLGNTQASLEAALEKMNAYLENEINRIYQESEDRLVGKWGSFDALDAAMERQHNLADEYLTKTNQLYETNTLLRKLSQDIDKTDNIAAKAKLKAFSDEIESMKEMNQLSKAELDIAKARYEVLLAQITLEEAQNAKSTVRLQRDSEGNYGYVYTADQDKVNDAEQELANKQNDLYNLVLGQTQDYTEKIIQHTQERNAALQELDEQWLNGEITDYNEYLRLREDITTKYNDLIKTDYENYYRAVGWLNQVGAEGQTEAWTDSFTDILSAQDTFATEIEEETNNVVTEINAQMEWLDSERAYWTEQAKVGNKELGDTVDDVTETVSNLTKRITDKNTGLIKAMADAMDQAGNLTEKFALQSDELKNLAEKYKNAADEADSYYRTIANWTRTEEALSPGEQDNQEEQNTTPPPATPSPSGLSKGANGIDSWTSISYSGNASNRIWKDQNGNQIGVTTSGYAQHWSGEGLGGPLQNAFDRYYVSTGRLPSSFTEDALEFIKRDLHNNGFDTGGYTGAWEGGLGKLALLHSKELVLNAEDTENFLAAIDIIRQITSAIDLRAASQALSPGINSPTYMGGEQILEQQVTIHAEFPNAIDHSEIEQAFDTLVNRATQYANRK